MRAIEDDLFGLLQWDTRGQEWQGTIIVGPHGEIGVVLPTEYVDSDETRQHIRATMKIIERDETGFRERAANELFAHGGYALFLADDEQFDHASFVNEMHLGMITFDPPDTRDPVVLWYEFGEGMEYGITIIVTWDGVYQYTRVA